MKSEKILLFLKLVLLSNLIGLPAISFAGKLYQNLSPKDRYHFQKLLHYQNNISRLDGEKFFFAPDGKTNPESEFEATLVALKNKELKAGWFDYPAQCVFPARVDFYKQLGLITEADLIKCPMLEEWMNGLNAESLTLVFSSSYPNNPSSLFGHTLIRLNQKNKTNDLLDYAVSFSAIPDPNDLGFVFAFKGMFGGYRGLIEISKYYNKVGDYNNSESRDLLEYDLKLTAAEMDRFIKHTWEVYQSSYADYYFLDENCSSFLADLLQVAMLDYPHIDEHSRWYYLPAELVTRLKKYPGLISGFHFRPSLKKQLKKRLSDLSEHDLQEIKAVKAGEENKLATLTTKNLDALISVLDYRRYSTKTRFPEYEKNLFRKALVQRSRDLNPSKVYTDYEVTNRPDEGHDSMAMKTYYRYFSGSEVGIEFKNGYHNLMSKDFGFDPFSQFDFLTVSVAYIEKTNKLIFDEAKIVHLTSIHPFTFFDPQISWNAEFTINRKFETSCPTCHFALGKMDGGPSIVFGNLQVINLFGGFFVELDQHTKRGFRGGITTEASYLISFQDKMKLGLFTEVRIDVKDKIKNGYQHLNGLKYSYFINRNQEINIDLANKSYVGKWSDYSTLGKLGYEIHF